MFEDTLKKIDPNAKPDHEYWYNFGKSLPYPMQIDAGTRPRNPNRRFETKEECQNDIDNGEPFESAEV